MNSGGASGSTTTVQKADPWEPQQPYLKQVLGEAQRLYGGGGGAGAAAPQYDQNAYNQALSAWESAGGGGFQRGADGVPTYNGQPVNYNKGDGYTTADGRRVDPTDTGTRAARPTLDQFAVPGPATPGTGSPLSPAYYPGRTIADQSPETLAAQGLTTQRALAGSPITNQAQRYMADVLSGGYLNANPYLDATYNKAADQVQGRVNSAFGQAGRFGGGLNQRALGDSLSGLATDIYGGNYQQERNRQQQGLMFAPQLANQDYYDLGQLANVGAAKEERAQDLINEDRARYDYTANQPLDALSKYQGLVSGNYGGTTTGSQPYYTNRGAGALGGALSGAGLASQFGAGSSLPWLSGSLMGPLGLGLGAVGGGLLGGLF